MHIELVYVDRCQDGCTLVIVDQLVLDFEACDGPDCLLLEELVMRRVQSIKHQIIYWINSLKNIVREVKKKHIRDCKKRTLETFNICLFIAKDAFRRLLCNSS